MEMETRLEIQGLAGLSDGVVAAYPVVTKSDLKPKEKYSGKME